jgi:hypothetical protein
VGPTGQLQEQPEKAELADWGQAASFVARVLALSRANSIDKAIDEVIEYFDEQLSQNNLNGCNDALREATRHLAQLDPAVSLAILSMTLVEKNRLPSRKPFFSELKRVLTFSRGEPETSRLLHGLA